jgi:hypothetical protein
MRTNSERSLHDSTQINDADELLPEIVTTKNGALFCPRNDVWSYIDAGKKYI